MEILQHQITSLYIQFVHHPHIIPHTPMYHQISSCDCTHCQPFPHEYDEAILPDVETLQTSSPSYLVFATDPGNPPGVWVGTGNMGRFGSRPVQKPDPEHLGRPNPYPYPSTRGFCRVWLDSSVPVSGSPFRVFLFMVAVIYVTVICIILTLVHHSVYWFHWQPFYSKQGETCSLLHPGVECDQVYIVHHL